MKFLQLSARSKDESHRTATTLELMFDLASVIAIAAAAAGLHHGIAAGHPIEAIAGFLASFFMIWWGWMNYAWFASAYDNGSAAFRLLSMAAMFGALLMAAGIPAVFDDRPVYLCLVGFIVMRVAMALFWFGAAAGDRQRRNTALTYGFGILAMQVYWIAIITNVPPTSELYVPLFLGGLLGELAVPAIAEMRYGATTWHRHHIIERYGLLNIIVLGECFLSVVAMLAAGEHGEPADGASIRAAIIAAVITFSLWGLYFTRETPLENDDLRHALLWGYGHFAIFASGAATGAGLAVCHEVLTGHAAVSERSASYAIAIPVAIYTLTLWLVRDRFYLTGWRRWILPVGALAVILAPALSENASAQIALAILATVLIRRQFAPIEKHA